MSVAGDDARLIVDLTTYLHAPADAVDAWVLARFPHLLPHVRRYRDALRRAKK